MARAAQFQDMTTFTDLATDQPSSSAHTRQTLGWEPSHPSLLEDLENIQP